MAPRLIIPSWAHYDCAGCGLCCLRGWEIGCTKAEKEKLDAVTWDHLPVQEAFVRRREGYRFALQENGRCGFLDEENRCRIHSRLGMKAKAYTCRAYPVYFSTTGPEVRVGLHYSCPAVIAQTGRPLESHRRDLEKLFAEESTRYGSAELEAEGTAFDISRPFSWNQLAMSEAAMLHVWDSPLSSLRKTIAMSRWLDRVDEYFTVDMDDQAFAGLSDNALARALEGAEHDGIMRPKLGIFETSLFRQLAGVASEMAVPGLLSPHFMTRQRARFDRVRLSLGFLMHRGGYHVADHDGQFADIAAVSAYPLDDTSEAMICDAMRMRFWTRAFFGQNAFGMGVLHGARFFLSLYGLSLYLARACAAAEHRTHVNTEDVRTALMLTEFCFGHIGSLHTHVLTFGMSSINRAAWAERAALYGALPERKG